MNATVKRLVVLTTTLLLCACGGRTDVTPHAGGGGGGGMASGGGVAAGGGMASGGGGGGASICTVGESRCNGDVLETCKVDGSGYMALITCQSGLCDAVAKQCDNCRAGATTCTAAGTIKTCSADGQMEMSSACPSSTPFCVGSAGSARCVACEAAS